METLHSLNRQSPPERLEALLLSVNHFFGYGSLPADFCEKHNIDIYELASRNKWLVDKGIMVHCFYRMAAPVVEFGVSYDEKTLKKLGKELKERNHADI